MAGRPRNISDLNDVINDDGVLSDTITPDPPAKKNITSTKEPEVYIFEMVGTFPRDNQNGAIRYPGLSLTNSQLVFDETTGTQRMMRILRGVTSPWVDEQKDITDKQAARLKPALEFNNGKLLVPAAEKNTLKFLQLCSDFEGCLQPASNRKHRYRLINTAAEETAALERKKKIREVSELAWKADMEDLIPHAKFLGINFTNDKGGDKSPDALRGAYVEKAESDPALFMKSYGNPKVKMYGLVRKAFEDNVIVFVDGQAIWSDTKVVIAQIPHDKVAPDYLSEMMLTRAGADLKSRLENL